MKKILMMSLLLAAVLHSEAFSLAVLAFLALWLAATLCKEAAKRF